MRRMLPEPYNRVFREFINVLHIEYFYNGRYPREGVEEEFNKWCRKVEGFVNNLERKVRRNNHQ